MNERKLFNEVYKKKLPHKGEREREKQNVNFLFTRVME